MNELTAAHNHYIAKARAAGRTILTFDAPCCGLPIETPATGGTDEVWDTLATCHYCGALFLKVTYHTTAKGVVP